MTLLRLLAFNLGTRLTEWSARQKRETQWLCDWCRETWR